MNENTINNNNTSNIIVNQEPEFKINPFQKNDICDDQKNNNNSNNMKRGTKDKVIEQFLLKKELNFAKKEKELKKKEKDVDARADELEKKEKNMNEKTNELNQLIEELKELNNLPKIVIEKIKLINLKNEDGNESLTQQEIIAKNSIREKEES